MSRRVQQDIQKKRMFTGSVKRNKRDPAKLEEKHSQAPQYWSAKRHYHTELAHPVTKHMNKRLDDQRGRETRWTEGAEPQDRTTNATPTVKASSKGGTLLPLLDISVERSRKSYPNHRKEKQG
ncbi:hypothetical protein TNCV_1662231 [Trichonephila clavipes]|nr:hypothetical protein TNCV_1662231 [Trichonephila clavipes]